MSLPLPLAKLRDEYIEIIQAAAQGRVSPSDGQSKAEALRATDAEGSVWGINSMSNPFDSSQGLIFVRFNSAGIPENTDPSLFVTGSLRQTPPSNNPWNSSTSENLTSSTPQGFPQFSPAPSFPQVVESPSFNQGPSSSFTGFPPAANQIEEPDQKEPKVKRKIPKPNIFNMSPRSKTIALASLVVVGLLVFMFLNKKQDPSDPDSASSTTVAASTSVAETSTSSPESTAQNTTTVPDSTPTSTLPTTPTNQTTTFFQSRVYDATPGKGVPFTVKLTEPGATFAWVLVTAAPASESVFVFAAPAGSEIIPETLPVGVIGANPSAATGAVVLVPVNPATGETTFVVSAPDRIVIDTVAFLK